jgi:hypothetical protein
MLRLNGRSLCIFPFLNLISCAIRLTFAAIQRCLLLFSLKMMRAATYSAIVVAVADVTPGQPQNSQNPHSLPDSF